MVLDHSSRLESGNCVNWSSVYLLLAEERAELLFMLHATNLCHVKLSSDGSA